MMKALIQLMWVANLFSSGFAVFVLVAGVAGAGGAPGEAAAAAIACAVAIIPYVATRSMDSFYRLDSGR